MAELTLVGMRVVRAVADRGSFTAAAVELGYTQSAVSRQVAAMEAAAGAPLFSRAPRGVALTEAGRPNAMLSMEMVDSHSIGQLVYMLELAVAVMGEHYDVDAFDQPGVEAGKIAAYALMGRSGYEGRRREIEQALPRRARSV